MDILTITSSSPRKQRIAAVREMAVKLEVFCDRWSVNEEKFEQIKQLITDSTFKHRREYGGTWSESVQVEVDYMIVTAFADAYELLSNHDGVVPAHMLGGNASYLMVLSLVACNSLHSNLMKALSSSDPQRVIESSIHIGELSHAARLINYSEDIRG